MSRMWIPNFVQEKNPPSYCLRRTLIDLSRDFALSHCQTLKITGRKNKIFLFLNSEMTEELEANPLYESLSREAAALKLRTEATEERMENLQERIFNKFLIKIFEY